MLKGRNIIVGVTGSIAAYKAAVLVRALVKDGADVRVVMTPLAKEFITPLTMATLSKHPVPVEFFNPENGEWNSHVRLGEWADALIVAPATANTLAKMAAGIADNLLLTTCLSARCPVFVAPAMDLDMWGHAATQTNLATLRQRGVGVVSPGEGELASGLSGPGRMAEPEIIVDFLSKNLRGCLNFATELPTSREQSNLLNCRGAKGSGFIQGISDSDREIFSRGEGGVGVPAASEPGEKSTGSEVERPRMANSKQPLN